MARIKQISKTADLNETFGTVTKISHTPETLNLGKVEEARNVLESEQRNVYLEQVRPHTANLPELHEYFSSTLSQYGRLLKECMHLEEALQYKYQGTQRLINLAEEVNMVLNTSLRGIEKVNGLVRELETNPYSFETQPLFPRMVADILHRMKSLNNAKAAVEERLPRLLECVTALNEWLQKNAHKVAREMVYIPSPQPKLEGMYAEERADTRTYPTA